MNTTKPIYNTKPTKTNPMEKSPYCYYQSLGKAVVGLEKALDLREGKIENIYPEDILAYTDIDPEEFINLFKNPRVLLDDIHKEISKLLSSVIKISEESAPEEQLANVFHILQKNFPMVRVLHKTNDYSIWKANLRQLVINIATDWPPVDTPAWDFLYANFYCQFALILEKWETTDFSETHLKDCVRLMDIWLTVDGMLGSMSDDLLDDWTKS